MRTSPFSRSGQILVVTVGLPGRGKTHLAHAIQRYLRWMGVRCEVFNLGNTRREILGCVENLPIYYFGEGEQDEEMVKMRQQVTNQLEDNIVKFFDDGGQVAVYDANNSTEERRRQIRERFEARNVQLLHIGTPPPHARMPM